MDPTKPILGMHQLTKIFIVSQHTSQLQEHKSLLDPIQLRTTNTIAISNSTNLNKFHTQSWKYTF